MLTGAWLCTAGALDGGGAVLEGGGGAALEGGGGAALDGGDASLEGAGGVSLETAGGAALSGSACDTGSSGCDDAMGSAVPKNRDAVSTAHRTAQIDQTKKPVRFVFLFIVLSSLYRRAQALRPRASSSPAEPASKFKFYVKGESRPGKSSAPKQAAGPPGLHTFPQACAFFFPPGP